MGMEKRKRSERRATDSDEHYRLLIDAVAEYALFLLGPDGTVISWGPGAEQVSQPPPGARRKPQRLERGHLTAGVR